MGIVAKAFGLAGKGVISATLGGGGRRMLTGAAIGGITGAARSEEGSQMGFLGDVLGGAAIGAGIGMATSGTFWKTAGFLGREAARLPQAARIFKASKGMGSLLDRASFAMYGAGRNNIGKNLLEAGYGAGNVAKGVAMGVGKAALGVGRFALNRPKTAAAMTLGGLGIYGLANTGYGETGANNEAMSMMAEARNLPSTAPGGDMGYLNAGGYGINPINMTRPGRAYSTFMGSTDGLVQGLHSRRHT